MKIGAIIQARYDSSRLKGKVLKNLPFDSDQTILSQIHNRLNNSKLLDEVIIATSDQPDDDIIESYAKDKNIICVRGSKDNVLERFVKVIQERSLDVVIRITGDNPIILLDIFDKVVQKHIESECDYTRNNNLPYGTSFEVINANVLTDIYNNKQISKSDEEHVTIYIKNNREEFKIQEIEHNFEPIDFRFTVDYPSDYAAMNILFQYIRQNNYLYEYNTLKSFINENEWLSKVNNNNLQKKQFSNFQEELDSAIDILSLLDFSNIKKVLKDFKLNLKNE